jgi:peptidoglycan pentaglycine glycine transferase (the first glycine)
MYKFIETVNFEEFDGFVEKSNETSFMQLSRWAKLKPTWKPKFFSGYDDKENIVLTALILERELVGAGRIWYSPSGFICDYENGQLVKEFADFIKSQEKKNKVTAYIIDPQIVEKISDAVQESAQNKLANIKSAGFMYNKNRDDYTYQPPMTVGIYLDDNGEYLTAEKLLKKFEKGVRYSIRIGEQRGLVAERYLFKDIENNTALYDDFLSVMNDTSGRVGFVQRPYEYYLDFMREFAEFATIDLIYYDKSVDAKLNSENFQKLKEIKDELKTTDKKSVINRLKNETQSLESSIKAYHQRVEETRNEDKEKICVACGLTIRFANEACCLFGGTRDIIRNNVRSSHYLNFLRIKQSIDEKIYFHDMGRVPDEYTNENSPHHGLYTFKKSFAADRVEYIGEYILVSNKLKYFIYHTFMPFAKRTKNKLVKAFKK